MRCWTMPTILSMRSEDLERRAWPAGSFVEGENAVEFVLGIGVVVELDHERMDFVGVELVEHEFGDLVLKVVHDGGLIWREACGAVALLVDHVRDLALGLVHELGHALVHFGEADHLFDLGLFGGRVGVGGDGESEECGKECGESEGSALHGVELLR